MKISTRGEYAVRAMLELGLANGEGVSLKEVAQRWHVSLDYLEQIMPALRKAGLVRSKRGAKGGYQLGKPAETITLAEIVETLEGRYEPMECLSNPRSCFASGACAIQEAWRDVQGAVHSVLNNVTLADLIAKQKTKRPQSVARQHYSI